MSFENSRVPTVFGLTIDDIIYIFDAPSIRVKTAPRNSLYPNRARFAYMRNPRYDREMVEAENTATQEELESVFAQHPEAQVSVFIPSTKSNIIMTFAQYVPKCSAKYMMDGDRSVPEASYFLHIPEDNVALHRMTIVKRFRRKWYIGRGLSKKPDGGYVVPLCVFEKQSVNRVKLLLPDYRDRLMYSRISLSVSVKDTQVLENLKALKTWSLM